MIKIYKIIKSKLSLQQNISTDDSNLKKLKILIYICNLRNCTILERLKRVLWSDYVCIKPTLEDVLNFFRNDKLFN